jgi:hypothetical protein
MAYRARLRIELPDRPGALGRIGQVIGDLGGNVCGVDIQEVDGEHAVDELLVDLPDHVRPADVGFELRSAGAGLLRGSSPGSDRPDPIVRALRWACALTSAGSYGADDEAERALATICGTSCVWLATVEEAKSVEAGRLALARGKAISHRTADPPSQLGPMVDDEMWLLAVPDARLEPLRVAMAARPLADRFTAGEVERVSALLGLRRLVAGASAVAVAVNA